MNLPAGEAFLTFKMIDYPSKTVQVDKADMGDIMMDKYAPENVVILRDSKLETKSGPLCIIKKPNGEISKGSLDSVTSGQIKTMNIFKDKSVEQFSKYGDTSNGVILIELN